jgi:hypothetical protein
LKGLILLKTKAQGVLGNITKINPTPTNQTESTQEALHQEKNYQALHTRAETHTREQRKKPAPLYTHKTATGTQSRP